MTFTSSGEGPQYLTAVHTGMRVQDSTGEEIGTVERVKMSDPRGLTADRQIAGEPESFLGHVVESVSGPEPDVPPGDVAKLVRLGYLKVDGNGLVDRDCYVAADEITGVEDDVVYLSVPRDQLVTEA
jgi:hypothetical protein